ncbi:hypothetical protein A1O3_06792 [Capronia epimyces CBS 606.96]|uniref:NADAR domain-containing protein n=1 Tax=Capronia epimyces CBS 606.96 TaxID=1182542 RepID=W9Y027_9EURO|nr:uncharacterized protein A1O3_06792 [Capronia epimyces CBS 606.96]EXJ82975.1 hypothetical protein A1O3_06792 [Capronia epimyces CBS 606.96]
MSDGQDRRDKRISPDSPLRSQSNAAQQLPAVAPGEAARKDARPYPSLRPRQAAHRGPSDRGRSRKPPNSSPPTSKHSTRLAAAKPKPNTSQHSYQSADDDESIEHREGVFSVSPPHRNSRAEVERTGSKLKAQGHHHKQNPSTTTPAGARGTRITDKHIIFLGGPLSNWNVGERFSGARAMDLLIRRLDAAGIRHPSHTALSTRIMDRHMFVCGEQFMMAAKGWLFEREWIIPGAELETGGMSEQQVAGICDKVLGPEQVTLHSASTSSEPPSSAAGSNRHGQKASKTNVARKVVTGTATATAVDFTALNAGTIVSCILNPSPRAQKQIGRQTRNFDEAGWAHASPHVVVAASVARAEVDPELCDLYLRAKGRKFVEGSPVDRIWGIGLKWDDGRADDETRWRGENRLGECHDQAAAFFSPPPHNHRAAG